MYRRRPGARTVAVAPGVVAAATPLIFEEAEGKAIANLDSHARASGSLGVESQPVLLEGARIGSSRDRLDVTVHRLTLDGDYDASLVLLTAASPVTCAPTPEAPSAIWAGLRTWPSPYPPATHILSGKIPFTGLLRAPEPG